MKRIFHRVDVFFNGFCRLIDPEKADENVLLLLRHLSPVLLVTVASLAAGIVD